MRIGFDAKRAAQNRTGLGNYSRFVLRILSEKFPSEEYHLFIPKRSRTPFLHEIPTIRRLVMHFPHTWPWRRLSAVWRIWGMTADIKDGGMDIYHGLSNELPLNIRRAGCKSIVTIHDLIFRHTPEYYKPIDRWIYDYKFRRACKKADHVIAVSKYTKQEIMRYYGTPENKITVVYQGCDPIFGRPISQEILDDVRKRYGLPDKYVLFVGSIEERKNLMLVAKAIACITSQGKNTGYGNTAEEIKVVAVGKPTKYLGRIKAYLAANGISDRFSFHHNVKYADLPAFYRMAAVFAYPSRIEGFGIPLLEALTAGVPAIGCTGSCLEEAGGPHSIYTDPDDPHAMATAIAGIWSDSNLAREMSEKGYEYIRNFTDDRLAECLMDVYKNLRNGC